jgi:NAD(P)-dependent dehydrogenase (short-subunit alcohol dehydrogenase family)
VLNESCRTLVVTGGSRGIGAAVARLAGCMGYSVAVNFLCNEAAARGVVEEIRSSGGAAVAIQGDVASEADIMRLFQEAEQQLGPICGLVNNAGVTGGFSRVETLEAASLEQVLTANIAGTILCAREAVKRMSTRHGGHGGVIVNISSLAARTGGAGEWVHYAASKRGRRYVYHRPCT